MVRRSSAAEIEFDEGDSFGVKASFELFLGRFAGHKVNVHFVLIAQIVLHHVVDHSSRHLAVASASHSEVGDGDNSELQGLAGEFNLVFAVVNNFCGRFFQQPDHHQPISLQVQLQNMGHLRVEQLIVIEDVAEHVVVNNSAEMQNVILLPDHSLVPDIAEFVDVEWNIVVVQRQF